MQELAPEEQLATLIALKAGLAQGKSLAIIYSEFWGQNEDAVADAWQKAEIVNHNGGDYSSSLVATGLFSDAVATILMIANRCDHWSTALDAAIDYITRRHFVNDAGMSSTERVASTQRDSA